ncbi:unnamed protein product [Bursaphelenchus okinawaensis]|uniref:Acid phosphatase n=1 Tax=Bursaphelenchus okinawaensis TaxID=465554 RepID=A0A811K996_9BILA|nr:unnamed protein product [Bursaphelenchus okinawaensis]CAG9095587.1 unnamed protein product [Bursaphelenchus okinawaensis]
MKYYLLLLCYVAFVKCDKLKFVQTIWRHGDRAPGDLPYPLDKYDESYWPRGWSMLTTEGMKQMHDLGKFYRERYVEEDFISSEFNSSEVYIQTSESDRAIQSAQAMLSGLYPPKDSDQFDDDINWHPVPVHGSEPTGKDMLLKPTSFDCPTYESSYDPIETKLDSELMEEYKELVTFLQPVSGYGSNMTMKNAVDIADVQLELLHNLDDQPSWLSKKWDQYDEKKTLEILLKLKEKRRLNEFADPSLAKLVGGYLLGDWLKRLEQVQNGTQMERMIMYSAHDGTLLSLTGTMGVLDDEMIPYASALIMEVSEDDDKLYVKMYYRKTDYDSLKQDKDGDFKLKKLKFKCGEKCHLDEFIAEMKPQATYSKLDVYKQCGLQYCVQMLDDQPCLCVKCDKLRFVQTIWRHGDRAPSQLPYPLDKYNESYWPRGWSMLTTQGMAQMFNLGKFYRERYVDTGYINREFKISEVYIQSSESDRAIQSAQAMLSGLYPPKGSDLFNSAIYWQPVPVHGSQKLGKDMFIY